MTNISAAALSTNTTANEDDLMNAQDLAEAAIEVRDSWKAYATYLMDHAPAPHSDEKIAEARELLEDALRADEDLADMINRPEHYAAERVRLAQSAQRYVPAITDPEAH